MNNLIINNMRVVPCVNSKFVKTSRVMFNQNGVERTWDYISVHDSVAVLLFNTTRKAFVLVKQFRPAVYMHRNRLGHVSDKQTVVDDCDIPLQEPVTDGVTYELCAGIVDKNTTLTSIIKQETLEECGYDVPESNFTKIFASRGSVGVGGSQQTVFYAEATNEMIVNKGGGNKMEGEFIELEYLPETKVKDFLFDESLQKPPSLMAAFLWYLNKQSNT